MRTAPAAIKRPTLSFKYRAGVVSIYRQAPVFNGVALRLYPKPIIQYLILPGIKILSKILLGIFRLWDVI